MEMLWDASVRKRGSVTCPSSFEGRLLERMLNIVVVLTPVGGLGGVTSVRGKNEGASVSIFPV